jgi:long-chain acyl-CoA synthetase
MTPTLATTEAFMTIEELRARDFCAFPECIRFHAADRPTAPALTQAGRSLDYRALDALADRVASALQRDGVVPGEVVAVCAATSIEYGAVFTGALRAGVAVAPIAPSSTAAGVAGMAADAGARILFLDAAVAELLAPLRGRIAAAWVTLDGSDAGRSLEAWPPRCRSGRSGRSTSSIPPAPPARRKASCSRMRCAGRSCAAPRCMATVRNR